MLHLGIGSMKKDIENMKRTVQNEEYISEVKNTLERISSRLEGEDQISNLADKIAKNIQ